MKKKFVIFLMAVIFMTGCGSFGKTAAGGGTSSQGQESKIDNLSEDVSGMESSEAQESETESGVYHFTLDENGAELEIRCDENTQQYEIQDGDQVTVFRLEKLVEPISAMKTDIDGDGEAEYMIIACAGRGTGVYVTDLMAIKKGREEPMAYLSNEEITEQLGSRTELTYDEDLQMVTLYCDSESEPKALLYLEKFLEKMNATYDTMSLGNVIGIENRDNRYWVTADFAVYTKEMASPQYECTIHLTAPLTYQDNQTFAIGNISAKSVDYTQMGEIKEDEIIAEFYADVTHDGTEDRIAIFVPEGNTWDEVLSGVASGELCVYAGYTDVDGKTKYADESILEREFSPCHVGNGQMFLTTVDGRDYLIETDFWVGQEQYTYGYTVFFLNYDYDYVMASEHEEYKGEPGDTSAFFEKLNCWINDSSIVLYAADIDHDPDLLYSTDDNRINPRSYLIDKAEQ